METLKECIIKIMLDSIKLYPFQEGSQGAIIMIKKKILIHSSLTTIVTNAYKKWKKF